jgi:hypothetical protein
MADCEDATGGQKKEGEEEKRILNSIGGHSACCGGIRLRQNFCTYLTLFRRGS